MRLVEGNTYENVVILSPVNPNPAVQAGMRQASKFTTTIIAKQSQNARPMAPPVVPTFRVATAMLALNLDRQSLALISTKHIRTDVFAGMVELMI